MLVNSNQDFSVYVNILFQGVQKLYVTRLLQDGIGESVAIQYEKQQMRDAQDDVFEDFENQLEEFINLGRFG